MLETQKNFPDLKLYPNIWNKDLPASLKKKIFSRINGNIAGGIDLRGCETLAHIKKRIKVAKNAEQRTRSFKANIIINRRAVVIGKNSYATIHPEIMPGPYIVITISDIPAANGRIALEILKRTPIDLLFTDIIMPGGISGVELAQQVRTFNPQIKILYTSGYPENSLSNHNLIIDANLIGKPYRKENLARKIRAILNQKEEK